MSRTEKALIKRLSCCKGVGLLKIAMFSKHGDFFVVMDSSTADKGVRHALFAGHNVVLEMVDFR